MWPDGRRGRRPQLRGSASGALAAAQMRRRGRGAQWWCRCRAPAARTGAPGPRLARPRVVLQRRWAHVRAGGPDAVRSGPVGASGTREQAAHFLLPGPGALGGRTRGSSARGAGFCARGGADGGLAPPPREAFRNDHTPVPLNSFLSPSP